MVQGHAIECRINAEDPFKNFRPGPGRVIGYLAPGGPHVRMDSHLYPDYLVPPNYDSLLGKLIVWADTRDNAISRMKRALSETVISGVRAASRVLELQGSRFLARARLLPACPLTPFCRTATEICRARASPLASIQVSANRDAIWGARGHR